jgi:hypothetical protein
LHALNPRHPVAVDRLARVFHYPPMRQTSRMLLLALCLVALPAGVCASTLAGPPFGGWQPPVPVSALARPVSWIEPSRLHVSTTVSMGTSWTGSGMDALQVTRLSYQFRAPVAFSVSLGNAWGAGAAGSGKPSVFLEGMRMAWQPSASSMFSVEFRQLRSPLQYQGYGFAQPSWP